MPPSKGSSVTDLSDERLRLLEIATEVAQLSSQLAAARVSDQRPEQKDRAGNVVTATDRWHYELRAPSTATAPR